MLRFCCWNYHQRAFQSFLAQMDFTSLCTSPEPKPNLQVKPMLQLMWRCLATCVCPSPNWGAGSHQWGFPQKGDCGENFASDFHYWFNKKKKKKKSSGKDKWNFMRFCPLGREYTLSLLFPLEAQCLCQQPLGQCFNLVLSFHCWQRILRHK